MRKRWLAYSLAGVLAYMIFLVATMPAAWLSSAIVGASGGALIISATQGTVWEGQGELTIRLARTPPRSLGQLSWEANPIALLIGRLPLTLKLSAPGTVLRADVALTPWSINVSKLDASFPANMLETMYSPVALVGLSGEMQLDAQAVVLQKNYLKGRLVATWLNAGSALSAVKPLADYRLNLIGDGNSALIRVETLRGKLRMAGDGKWDLVAGDVQFSGNAEATSDQEKLEPLLRMLGPSTGDGRRKISLFVNMAHWVH